MSTKPKFTDHSPTSFDKGGRFDPEKPRYSGSAIRAVARSAGVSDEKANTFDVVVADLKGLVEDAADVVCALNWVMTYAGFGEGSRAWVESAFSLIEQGEGDGCDLTDPEFAEHLNSSERTIIRKRKQYQKEAGLNGFDVLAIDEGDFDRQTGKNRPTHYTLACRDLLVRIVERARGSHVWERGETRRAIKEEAKAQFLQEPDTPSLGKKRKGKTRSVESEIESLKKTMRTLTAKLGDLERQRSRGNVREMWQTLKGELDEIVELAAIPDESPQIVDTPADDRRVDNLVTPSPTPVVTPSVHREPLAAVTSITTVKSPDNIAPDSSPPFSSAGVHPDSPADWPELAQPASVPFVLTFAMEEELRRQGRVRDA
jgi:hypothetical protein